MLHGLKWDLLITWVIMLSNMYNHKFNLPSDSKEHHKIVNNLKHFELLSC